MAGGDGEGARSDHFAAFDVVGGVTDDPDICRIKFMAGMVRGSAQRVRAEIIAHGAVVGEGPEGEIVPQVEVTELDLGATLEVAGEQSLDDVGSLLRGVENLGYPRQNAGGLLQLNGKSGEIGINELSGVFRGVLNAVFGKNFLRDPFVGATGPIDVGQVRRITENFGDGLFKRPDAGPRGCEQGAVNVPKKEFHTRIVGSPKL